MPPPFLTRSDFRAVITLIVGACLAAPVQAIPALSSHPGAAYTVYLDFGGFTYTGAWSRRVPGTTAAYGSDAVIADTWARAAEKYAPFDVNVTTVDPAVAAGRAGSDLARQAYYDNTPRLMHTVIGGTGSWYGNAGGVSYVGVTQDAQPNSGRHENWIFALNNFGDNPKYLAEATAHENGHGFGLKHQSDYHIGGGTAVNEYSTNNGASGSGSYAPIIGESYYSQRGTWRVGTNDNGNIQNDAATILANSGMSFRDDSVGHSFAAATAIPVTGSAVDSTLAKGVITPVVGKTPNPLGVDNYTKDYFRFSVAAPGAVTLQVSDGGDWLSPGAAAGGATLRSRLNLYRASDPTAPFAFATESSDTLSMLFAGALDAGYYVAEITSNGGYTSTFDPSANYYEMGSYVLSGSGIGSALVVPEASSVLLFASSAALTFVAGLRRNRYPRRCRGRHTVNPLVYTEYAILEHTQNAARNIPTLSDRRITQGAQFLEVRHNDYAPVACHHLHRAQA